MQKKKKKKFPPWILVIDRVPDTRGEYLVFVDLPARGQCRMVAEWHVHFGWSGPWSTEWPVTHWMPLPSPPEV